MPTSIIIELDNAGAYQIAGESLNGRLVLTVEKDRLTVREIKLRVICDVDTSMTVNTARPDQNEKLKIEKSKVRIYDGEMDINLNQHLFKQGQHAIPFKLPLPQSNPTLPPSATTAIPPSTYGNIQYTLKAHAKKLTSSWFSANELKTSVPFLFMPVSLLSAKALTSTKLRQEPFNEVVAVHAIPEKGLMAKLLNKKPKPERPLEIKGIFSHPEQGILPGAPAPFKLRIQTGLLEDTVLVKAIALKLNTILVLRDRKNQAEYIVRSEPIVEELILKSGREIDLSDVVGKNRIPSTLTPSFDTQTMSFRHTITIELSVVRNNNSAGNAQPAVMVTHRVPVKVMSPFTRGESIPETNDNIGAPVLPVRPQRASVPDQLLSEKTQPNHVPFAHMGSKKTNSKKVHSEDAFVLPQRVEPLEVPGKMPVHAAGSSSEHAAMANVETTPNDEPPNYQEAMKE